MSAEKNAVVKKHQRRKSYMPQLRFFIGSLVLLGILVASYTFHAFSPCVWVKVGPVTLMCPLGFLEISLAGRFVSLSLFPGFVLVCLLIFALGRLWCGWVCPASLAGSTAASVLKWLLPAILSKKIPSVYKKLGQAIQKRVSFTFQDGLSVLAGLLLGVAVFGYPLWSIICPLGVVSRNLIALGTDYTLRYDLVLLFIPLVVLLFFRGGWKCACPVGVLQGTIATNYSALKPGLKQENNCNQCGVCQKLCPIGLNPAAGTPDPKLCTRCGICIEKCPRNCLEFKAK